jgi:short-subunit dehydrogenase
MKARDLQNMTVIITGASSGIGRAAALAFAAAHANVVLAARRRDRLEQLALECQRRGIRALAVRTDVTHPDSVTSLVRRAIEWSGNSVDVFINNAGVGAVGEFTEVPIATHDQIIRTNLLGYLHGAHAVLPVFKQQAHGVLINTISLGGWVPTPYSVAYSASKFGLRGFSEALRAELTPYPNIHVCDVFPAFIDTPGFEHGANYMGREIKPIPPVYPAERVARAMVSLAQRPRNAVTVGASATVARVAHLLMGGFVGRLMQRAMQAHFSHARNVAKTDGSVFEPRPDSISAL